MASLKRWLDRRKNPWKGLFYDAFKAWRRDNAAERLKSYSDLPTEPTVFDFGGYKGEWTDVVLADAPDAKVHIFEPHPRFAKELEAKYADKFRISVYPFALGSRDDKMHLSDADNASSSVADGGGNIEAPIHAVSRFFDAHQFSSIELMKMNIEGGEYDLLPALIDAGVMARVEKLQVQFHLFDEGFIPKRDAIREALSATHDCAWVYPFVWEEWRKRK